jgi:hypothetical protein
MVIIDGNGVISILGSPLDDMVLAEIPAEIDWGTKANGSCIIGAPLLAPAEPIDVPAVQKKRTYKTGTRTITLAPECDGSHSPCDRAIITEDTATEKVTTCADKSRILLHDENNPPKYWCHKVQN